MSVQWSDKAVADLKRLYEFLALVNKAAATKTIQKLTQTPSVLAANPRIGEQLFQFDPREVRRIFVGDYEVRYEVRNSDVYLLRVWHTRENR